jgi:STE24 endopeptidase
VGRSDIAGLPLLALTVGVVSLLLLPVAHALSRAHERRADRYALEMTQNPAAFVSAHEAPLVAEPGRGDTVTGVEWIFHSHPSTSARIAAAQRWAAQRAQ